MEAANAQPGFVVWGLTGGIASGKSAAARFFEQEGIPVIDADQISRELSREGGPAHPLIVQRFGTGDRAKLREAIFADPKARRDLEAILHPLIQMESLRQMKALAEKWAPKHALPGHPLPILYEAALLVETGRYRTLKGLIVVEAPRELRIERLIGRDGGSRPLAEKILGAQASDEARRQAATYLLENSGSLELLHEQVRSLARKLLSG
ncbi:MAG: dephospho-CoA kinase [Oligoflexia bacterium]|nr:dephospho-CoA kinase [Oligoflexia bacterium]